MSVGIAAVIYIVVLSYGDGIGAAAAIMAGAGGGSGVYIEAADGAEAVLKYVSFLNFSVK